MHVEKQSKLPPIRGNNPVWVTSAVWDPGHLVTSAMFQIESGQDVFPSHDLAENAQLRRRSSACEIHNVLF